jgi:hypothetical protein
VQLLIFFVLSFHHFLFSSEIHYCHLSKRSPRNYNYKPPTNLGRAQLPKPPTRSPSGLAHPVVLSTLRRTELAANASAAAPVHPSGCHNKYTQTPQTKWIHGHKNRMCALACHVNCSPSSRITIGSIAQCRRSSRCSTEVAGSLTRDLASELSLGRQVQ